MAKHDAFIEFIYHCPQVNQVTLLISKAETNKMLSYRRETALQGTLVLAESGRLKLRDNILLIL